jgi:shikimate dehydrogenase
VSGHRAAVLGHPISHSLSPVLHRAAYTALGLTDWSYDAVDVAQEELYGFLRDLDDSWAGLSLTMPLKQTVIPLLDEVEPLAAEVGAVNTVVITTERRRRVTWGFNTDVHGLVEALREGLGQQATADDAVVLGAGATAASTLAALRRLGCDAPRVLVRDLTRTTELEKVAARLGVTPRFALLDDTPATLASHAVVVSTLPPHAADDLAAALTGPADGLLLDVAYDPRPTALASAWRAAGGRTVDGERMLLHQAAEQVRLMTRRPAPLDAMDAALRAALAT